MVSTLAPTRPARSFKYLQAAQKGPDARRRPKAAREAYVLYVERAVEGTALPQMGLFQQPASAAVEGRADRGRVPQHRVAHPRAVGREDGAGGPVRTDAGA